MAGKKIVKLVLGTVLCVQMLCTSGCFWLMVGGAAAGAVAGTAFVMGKLTGTVTGTMEQVKNATLTAFAEQKITETETKSIPKSITIIGNDSTGSGVRVVITPEGEGQCKVAVRFGTFGDEAKSNQLYNRIVQNLGTQATTISSTKDKKTATDQTKK